MDTKRSYYFILAVYLLLWSCQLIACHLTHSLIILTDSYINLYRILDISLGILHLNTQKQVGQHKESCADVVAKDEFTLFGHYCTYQFRRLPLIGSFINRLFLAALLMSAAIEGIQTCFHEGHSAFGASSILHKHPLTYPSILAGFSLVGAVMQWCSCKAHEMREDELQSESLVDLRPKSNGPIRELSVQQLSIQNRATSTTHGSQVFHELDKRHSIGLLGRAQSFNLHQPDSSRQKFSFSSTRNRSIDCMSSDNAHRSQISLRSLKMTPNSGDVPSSIFIDNHKPTLGGRQGSSANSLSTKDEPSIDRWLLVRYCSSPIALIICAMIFYFVQDEFITEVADATLAILVVILLFAASYPPMKKAGSVLLQTAPEGVDVDWLKNELKTVSPAIADIKEFHVWSLTPRSNRIATCHLVLKRSLISSDAQVATIMKEVKLKFFSQNIKCSTIQPILDD